jgi:hypothetical protein
MDRPALSLVEGLPCARSKGRIDGPASHNKVRRSVYNAGCSQNR